MGQQSQKMKVLIVEDDCSSGLFMTTLEPVYERAIWLKIRQSPSLDNDCRNIVLKTRGANNV